MSPAGPSRHQVVAEILKCGKNPSYFINKYCKIQHPIKGLIPFRTYPYQDRCLEDFEKHKFNITLKSRQLGLSTLSAAYAVWLAIFHCDKNILVIATKLPTANNFIKKVKVMLAGLPSWLKLPKELSTAKSEVVFDNGSQIKAIPTSEDAGRSEALSLLIVDEAAFIRDFDDIWTGLWPTLSTGGRAIIISTPNGVTGIGTRYYRMWTEAEAGQNDFNAIRLEWNIHPEHDKKWYDEQVRQLGDARKVAQELLCDFQSSGDTYLQPDDLDWVRSQIRDPISKEGYNNNVWIWEKPVPGIKYVISGDVARGDSNDYSTFHVFNVSTSDIVAEFMGKVPPDRFAEILLEWGRKYNTALLAPEMNTYGWMTCVKLRDAEYPVLFYKKNKGDPWNYVSDDRNDVPGFDTQKKTRTQILSKLEESIRNRSIGVYSRRLHEQLRTFVWNNGKAMASSDNNDDLVISAAIGAWLVNGGEKVTQSELAMINALLKATSRTERGDLGQVSLTDQVRPVQTQMMINQMNPNSVKNKYGARTPTDHRKVNTAINDLSWLL
jgi:hypothetical protein